MVSNNMSGIEKLQECAYGMDQMQCDDVLVLADQIEREHASALQAFYERYETDIREARESRDIAIKEAAELRNYVNLAEDLVHNFRRNIAIMLGISCDGMADDVYDAIKAELDRRLMPPGMEWPKDRDKNPFDPRKLYDRGCGAVDFVQIGFVNGEQWASVVSHDGNDLLPEELGDCEPEVLGADGLPIKVGDAVWYVSGKNTLSFTVFAICGDKVRIMIGNKPGGIIVSPSQLTHTQPDTQERIDDDATMPPRRYYAEKIGHDVDLKDDEEVFTAVALSLLCRQRELDAKTMGGE